MENGELLNTPEHACARLASSAQSLAYLVCLGICDCAGLRLMLHAQLGASLAVLVPVVLCFPDSPQDTGVVMGARGRQRGASLGWDSVSPLAAAAAADDAADDGAGGGAAEAAAPPPRTTRTTRWRDEGSTAHAGAVAGGPTDELRESLLSSEQSVAARRSEHTPPSLGLT